MLDREGVQAGGRFASNNLVVGGLAPDHAAERDAAAMAPRLADEARGEREAERAKSSLVVTPQQFAAEQAKRQR